MGKGTALYVAILFVISACTTYDNPEMQRFAEDTNIAVKKGNGINPYLASSVMSVEHIEEVQPGVLEYSFVQTNRGYAPQDMRCKFVFIVNKANDRITGWRYINKPEYCIKDQ